MIGNGTHAGSCTQREGKVDRETPDGCPRGYERHELRPWDPPGLPTHLGMPGPSQDL